MGETFLSLQKVLLGGAGLLDLCYTRCYMWTSHISIVGELVRNAVSGPTPRPCILIGIWILIRSLDDSYAHSNLKSIGLSDFLLLSFPPFFCFLLFCSPFSHINAFLLNFSLQAPQARELCLNFTSVSPQRYLTYCTKYLLGIVSGFNFIDLIFSIFLI